MRLIYPSMAWDRYVALGVEEIRHYGAGSIQVVRRLRDMLEDLLVVAGEGRRPPLREQLDLLERDARREQA